MDPVLIVSLSAAFLFLVVALLARRWREEKRKEPVARDGSAVTDSSDIVLLSAVMSPPVTGRKPPLESGDDPREDRPDGADNKDAGDNSSSDGGSGGDGGGGGGD
jgi:uncharacterized membrane protein YgcG